MIAVIKVIVAEAQKVWTFRIVVTVVIAVIIVIVAEAQKVWTFRMVFFIAQKLSGRSA